MQRNRRVPPDFSRIIQRRNQQDSQLADVAGERQGQFAVVETKQVN